MAIYSSTKTANEVIDFDNVSESVYSTDMVGALALVAENTESYNKIMKAVGFAELACLESTGAEIIYEAADVKAFIEKIKNFFKAMLKKVKELFVKFINWIKSFFTKHEKANESEETKKIAAYAKNLNDEIVFVGYRYSNINNPGALFDNAVSKAESILSKECGINPFAPDWNRVESRNADNIDSLIDDIKASDSDEVYDKVRGAMLGQSSISDKEFSNEIKKFFRSGKDSREEIKVKNISEEEITKVIDGKNELLKASEDAFKKIEKVYNEIIANLEKAKKPLESDKDNGVNKGKLMVIINSTTSMATNVLRYVNLLNGGHMEAVRERVSSYFGIRSLIHKQMREDLAKKKAEEKEVKESGFVHSFENYLESVVIK